MAIDDLKVPRNQLLLALQGMGEALQKARRQFKDIKLGDRNWATAVSMLPKPLDGNRTIDAKLFGPDFEANAKKLNRHLALIAGSQGPSKGEAMIAAIDEAMNQVQALEAKL
jgi:hypothetical protein